jgi:glycosyltransferase involved in cell wall biosynthesis
LVALVRGKALVATSHSVLGLSLRPGIDFEQADSPREFAAACVRLLRDPERRRELGAAGRESVVQRFDWNAVGQTALAVVAETYERLGRPALARPADLATIS